VAGLLLGAAVAAFGWLLVRLPLTRIVAALRALPVTDRVLATIS
jgi:undecaprenyl-diphosphatase